MNDTDVNSIMTQTEEKQKRNEKPKEWDISSQRSLHTLPGLRHADLRSLAAWVATSRSDETTDHTDHG